VRTIRTSSNRAPFRLLSTRAPRQAVLRASFWLAPSSSTRPCNLPAKKTRDASNRRLPLVRLACTRTSCVSGFASTAFAVWMFRGVWASWNRTGGPDVSHRPGPLRRIVIEYALPRDLCLAASIHERGRYLPTAPDATEPLTSLSPPALALELRVPSHPSLPRASHF
jgi:hypothetical protein